MKVFIVIAQDTNFIKMVEKVFLSCEDALSYIKVKEVDRQDLFYSIGEYAVE
ncbi:MAG: hypothetical protein ACOYVD_06460 [Bacillota bacterium]